MILGQVFYPMMNNVKIPLTHPRSVSLQIREKLVEGFRIGAVAYEGLIAHGRGESFDYLLGEKTTKYALDAIRAAACQLLLARHPIISVNGNVAALCSDDLVKLTKTFGIDLEVNLFYRTDKREKVISKMLKKSGAEKVLGLDTKSCTSLPELASNRRRVDIEGIYKADVVLVPLEDGDRTESLVKLKKKVITVDLNPLSRTAQTSHISIIDNIVRVMPLLNQILFDFQKRKKSFLDNYLKKFDNKKNLDGSINLIRGNFS